MTNKHHTVLYTGVTNNIYQRTHSHQQKDSPSSFTARYQVNKLVYAEMTNDINAALAREKQIKAGSRKKKLELINAMNPEWVDLTKCP